MGLDIRAYEKVTPAPYATAEEADEHWEDDPPVVWLGEGHDTRRRDDMVGPKTSSKLAADFDASRATAAAFAETLPADEREWFSRVYEDFAKAFTIAARGGAVRFC